MFCLAIPGGSVADAVLPLLATTSLPWPQVHLFWVDERAVPITSPDSNAGRALALIRGTPMATHATIHRMMGAGVDTPAIGNADANVIVDVSADVSAGLANEAANYARTLHAIAGALPVLDVVLLGVGDDGHVASLFPGHASLNETRHDVIVEHEAPKAPPLRMSLSAPVLWNARLLVVAAFGTSKAEALRAALEDSYTEPFADLQTRPRSTSYGVPRAATPIAQVVRHAGHPIVLLDHDAASLLTNTPQESLI